MAKKSAGILLYRRRRRNIEVLLVHPGGPFWKSRDEHSWSIPKGEYSDEEEPIEAARREFNEEIGFSPEGEFTYLGEVRQKGGKQVAAWAIEGDCDTETIASNTFQMEWPPKSGRMQDFPEVDRAAWFDTETARKKINSNQIPLIDRLVDLT